MFGTLSTILLVLSLRFTSSQRSMTRLLVYLSYHAILRHVTVGRKDGVQFSFCTLTFRVSWLRATLLNKIKRQTSFHFTLSYITKTVLFTSYSDINMHLSLSLVYIERLLRFWRSCRFEHWLVEQIVQIFSNVSSAQCKSLLACYIILFQQSVYWFLCLFISIFIYLLMQVENLQRKGLPQNNSCLSTRLYTTSPLLCCSYRFSDLWVDCCRVAHVIDTSDKSGYPPRLL